MRIALQKAASTRPGLIAGYSPVLSMASSLFRGFALRALLPILVAAGVFAQEVPGSPSAAASGQGNPFLRPQWMRDPEKVHDPSSIVTVDGVRRFFCTGPGVLLVREDASGKWVREGRLFAEGQFPAWHEQTVPGNRGYLWAPDVIRLGEKFFVYYAVSTFGRNTSAIGLATGGSLDPASPQWRWEDRGPVIASRRGDAFNAIDPAIFRDGATGAQRTR